MPPTDPDRDTKPPAPKDQGDNPFIKFKRFADAQIGAVLQGIIGLPSVFSKESNDVNSRWADLHDDLKRRDRTLSEQQASKASESSRSKADPEDEEVDIPVKKFPGPSLPARTPTNSPISSKLDYRDGEQDSIDLFSPVMKSQFAHLIRKPIDDVDWSKYELLAQALDSSFEFASLDLQRNLRSDQKVGSSLNMIQSMTFNSLNRSTSNPGNSQLFSSQSVLPYILFSPYSPLALSSMPPPSQGSSLFADSHNHFPYSAAFEDLLLASQGRPMATLTPLTPWPACLQDVKKSTSSKNPQDSELWKANSGLEWIERLWNYGLLTKDAPLGFAFDHPLLGNPSRLIFPKLDPIKKIVEETSEQQVDHDTEQDVYNFFERIGGSVPSHLPFRDAMQAMEAFIKDAVKQLAEQENNTANDTTGSSERAFPRTAGSDPYQDELGTMRPPGFDSGKSASTQTESHPDHLERANATRSLESDQIEEVSDGSTVLPAKDRVVATTTTTQQTTDEDGSVHTTVMIQRIYADGRTLITTTTKANFPPKDRHFTEEEWLGLPENERCPHCDTKSDEKDESKHKKEQKSKGWFWN